jgi:bifunctional DNA-binding transcriptional regulator/antitoxin component of YhaV-PrlF toxin-antitoxin module
MSTSTLTDKGQTTGPREIRQALKVKPSQRLIWPVRDDGTVVVRPQPSAPALFGSLKRQKNFPGAPLNAKQQRGPPAGTRPRKVSKFNSKTSSALSRRRRNHENKEVLGGKKGAGHFFME